MKRSLCLPFLAAALLFCAACSRSPAPAETVSEPGFFENRHYDYALRFPTQLTLVEDSLDRQIVVSGDGTPVFQIAVAHSSAPLQAENRVYDSLVEDNLKSLCSSPMAECTGIASTKSILTPAGLKGSEYYLNEKDQSGVTSKSGPFFAFNMTDDPAKGLVVLIVGSPSALKPGVTDEEVIRSTINTLRVGRIGPTENGMTKAKLGEMCGGIAGVLCDDGLACKYDGNYPDAGGKCMKK